MNLQERLEAKGIPYERMGGGFFFSVSFFGEEIAIRTPSFCFTSKERRTIDPAEKILILEYLARDSRPIKTEGQILWIPLGGPVRQTVKKTMGILSQVFSEHPDLVRSAIMALLARKVGPSSFLLEPFPGHPMLLDCHNEVEISISPPLKAVLGDDRIVSLSKILQRKIMKRVRLMYEETCP